MTVSASFSDRTTLGNSVRIPVLGFGTYQYLVPQQTQIERVADAAKIGYRLFDTASLYRNEQGVGEGLRQSGVPREDLFIISKVWNQDQGYDSTLKVIDESLSDLKTDYLDLYLIHWPIPIGHDDDWQQLNRDTWRAMERCYDEGMLKSLGVSNFLEHHLKPLMNRSNIPVMANEIEMSAGFFQRDIHGYCKANDIQMISYSPMRGISSIADDLADIAEKYGKTPAQVSLRWNMQMGSIPIPCSYDMEHMTQNTDIFDFKLNEDELVFISNLHDSDRKHQHPDIDRIPIDRYTKTKI